MVLSLLIALDALALNALQPTELPDVGALEESVDPSSDLEELRALEEATIDSEDQTRAALRLSVQSLEYGTALRDRLEAALEAGPLGSEEFILGPVTDVERFDVALVKDRFDIPVEIQPLVIQYIRFFQGSGRKWFRQWMSRSSRFIPLMQPILESKGLPRDTVYLAMIESGFSTKAQSRARAVGPWQFIAGTARLFRLRNDFWVDERRDPVKSTRAAADYLSQLYANFGHWYLAWAGYNAGGGRVRRLVDTYGTTDFWSLADRKRGFAKETQHYVPKLIACALVAKHPDAFGFRADEFSFEEPFEFDEVQIAQAVDLEVVATAAQVSLKQIVELNPELRQWCTPPASDSDPYTLRLPKGSRGAFVANFSKYAPSERLRFQVHRVQRGDTLSKIAQTYHSATEAILRFNRLKSPRLLRVRSDLIIPVPSSQALKLGKPDVALERQVVRARRSGLVALRPEEEIPAGTLPSRKDGSPSKGGTYKTSTVSGKKKITYFVGAGDSLWSIARRFDVHVADLRTWNSSLRASRTLKVGHQLDIWPEVSGNN